MAARSVEDAGVIVTGARKHKFGKGLEHSDIAGMTEAEAAKLVQKDAVWPVPDWHKMIEDGMPAHIAAVVKIIRDRLPVQPAMHNVRQVNRPGDDIRRDYIDIVSTIREMAVECRVDDDLKALRTRILNSVEDYRSERGREILGTIDSAKLDYVFSVSHKDITRAKRMVAAGFPEKPAAAAWLRGLKFGHDLRNGTYYAMRGRKSVVARGFPSLLQLEEHLREAWEKAKETKQNGPKIPPARITVLEASREGLPDHRGGTDVTPRQFLDVFGFRAIQFGESMPDGERQVIVNTAHDALIDLAEVLGVDPAFLSLNGSLAAAFGSRGVGGFPAHYEPSQKIFNIGRLNGAGSLAHEWAHAFDHATGQACLDGKGATVYASGLKGLQTPLPADAGQAWDVAMRQILSRPLRRDEFADALVTDISRTKQDIVSKELRLATFIEKGGEEHDRKFVPQMTAHLQGRRRALGELETRLVEVKASPSETAFRDVPSWFLVNAVMLCGTSG